MLFTLLALGFREAFEDERVGLVGELGDEREIITAEAVGVVKVPGVVDVGPGEGDVVEFLLIGFVFPNRRFDAAEAEVLHRQFAGRGVLGLRSGLSGLGGHIVPFLILRSGIASSTRGGGAVWDEGTVGGIPFKEDPTLP